MIAELLGIGMKAINRVTPDARGRAGVVTDKSNLAKKHIL
jgi:hypothetical protein